MQATQNGKRQEAFKAAVLNTEGCLNDNTRDLFSWAPGVIWSKQYISSFQSHSSASLVKEHAFAF